MIHLHVRTAKGKHALDAVLYREAIAAIRREVGDRIVIQATSEAAGTFDRHQQIAAIRALKPECVSLAPREIAADDAALTEAAPFLSELARDDIGVQYILYDTADVERLKALMARGVIPDAEPFVLFVLGRYSKDQTSRPIDLLPFITAWEDRGPFALCAFGPSEAACALAALALGGHPRIGFENNLHLADGRLAPSNAALVAQTAAALTLTGRRLATADEARALLVRRA
jgi:uncharacterized protein (DUF849 family)